MMNSRLADGNLMLGTGTVKVDGRLTQSIDWIENGCCRLNQHCATALVCRLEADTSCDALDNVETIDDSHV